MEFCTLRLRGCERISGNVTKKERSLRKRAAVPEKARDQARAVAKRPRDIDLCDSCFHFEEQKKTPYCTKFKNVADDVIEDCGGPY